jgi:hypothetical protein
MRMAPPGRLQWEVATRKTSEYEISICSQGVQKLNVQPLNIFSNICQQNFRIELSWLSIDEEIMWYAPALHG